MIAVWYQSAAGTNSVLSLGTSASSSQSLGFSGNKYNFYQYGSAQESAYSQTTPSFVIQIGTRQSSVKAVYVNGTVGTTPASDSYNQTVTTVTIGKGDAFAITGEVAEIMVWTGTMSSTDRQLIESYLAQKWGLQLSLPASHSNNTTPAGLPAVVQEVYGKPKRIINPLTLKDFPQSTTFTYTTGVYQYYTVPAGITSVTVLMWGAGGGGVSGYNGWNGGGGACIQGTLSVTPGETLTIVVGRGAATSQTGTPTDAMGGGGPGYNNARGYGGGRSAIQRTEGTDIVTVGGGGGSGYGSNLPGGRGRGGAATGSGQACAGGNQNRSGTGDYGQGGEGGTQTRGGVGGTWISTGSSGTKGFGGSSPCGGGGGGWYGGGGGGGPFTAGEDGPGGGGSSYTGNLTSVTTWDASTNTAGNTGSSSWNGYGSGGSYVTTGGHGAVIITYYVSRLG